MAAWDNRLNEPSKEFKNQTKTAPEIPKVISSPK